MCVCEGEGGREELMYAAGWWRSARQSRCLRHMGGPSGWRPRLQSEGSARFHLPLSLVHLCLLLTTAFRLLSVTRSFMPFFLLFARIPLRPLPCCGESKTDRPRIGYRQVGRLHAAPYRTLVGSYAQFTTALP